MCRLPAIGYFVCLLLVIPNSLRADNMCVTPVTLLEGRRRIDGAVLTASKSALLFPPSGAKLDGHGWCSAELGADIFDPYLEVDFGTDVLFAAIVTQGFANSKYESPGSFKGVFIERYQVELARNDGHLWYLARSTNSSQAQAAVFPLYQESITSADRHTESLPVQVIGQTLRINPYQWNVYGHACTKLEVYGCPLQECANGEINLGINTDTTVTVNGAQINQNDLFDFGNTDQRYCVSTDVNPPTLIISYSSSVLLTEIGIRGLESFLHLKDYNQFVKNFSLAYTVGDDFVNYTRANGLKMFSVSDVQSTYFALWPPIMTTKLVVTINEWQESPCLNFLMLGCVSTSDNVVEHAINKAAPYAGLVTSHAIMTTTKTVIVPSTTVLITKTIMNSPCATQHPSSQSSNDDDDDDTPIYVSIAIVTVGLLLTALIVIIGVIVCRRRSRNNTQPPSSSDPLLPRSYGSINTPTTTIGVDNDLYGRPELQRRREEDSDEEPLPISDGTTNDYYIVSRGRSRVEPTQ